MNRRERPRTLGRFIREVLLTVLFLLVSFFVGARLHVRHQIHAEFARIRAAGQPVTLAELDQQYRDLGGRLNGGDELNGLLLAIHSVSQRLQTNGIPGTTNRLLDLPLFGPDPRKSKSPPPKWTPEEELDASIRPALQSALDEVRPSLNELRIVLARTNQAIRFPIDLTKGTRTLLPHLGPLNWAAKWQALCSASELAKGDHGEAVTTILDMLRLSRSLDREPSHISQLERFSTVLRAISTVDHLVNFHSLSSTQAELLRGELRLARPDRAIYFAMLGERCIGLDAMHFSPQSPTVLNAQAGGPDADERIGPKLFMLAYRMAGFASREDRYYLDTMREVVSVATNQVAARVALANNGKTFRPRSQGKLYILSSMMLPGLEKAFPRESDCLVAIAAADTALAVEAYRADHDGRLPSSLADLVPRYFEHVPLDPLTEKPLSLAPAEIGYAIIGSGPVFTVRR